MSAVEIRDQTLKDQTLSDLVKQLPSEHYHTLRVLMLHLHRVLEQSDTNLMSARNLGVVFGRKPSLLFHRIPNHLNRFRSYFDEVSRSRSRIH